jgi:hypothetical protein
MIRLHRIVIQTVLMDHMYLHHNHHVNFVIQTVNSVLGMQHIVLNVIQLKYYLEL